MRTAPVKSFSKGVVFESPFPRDVCRLPWSIWAQQRRKEAPFHVISVTLDNSTYTGERWSLSPDMQAARYVPDSLAWAEKDEVSGESLTEPRQRTGSPFL